MFYKTELITKPRILNTSPCNHEQGNLEYLRNGLILSNCFSKFFIGPPKTQLCLYDPLQKEPIANKTIDGEYFFLVDLSEHRFILLGSEEILVVCSDTLEIEKKIGHNKVFSGKWFREHTEVLPNLPGIGNNKFLSLPQHLNKEEKDSWTIYLHDLQHDFVPQELTLSCSFQSMPYFPTDSYYSIKQFADGTIACKAYKDQQLGIILFKKINENQFKEIGFINPLSPETCDFFDLTDGTILIHDDKGNFERWNKTQCIKKGNLYFKNFYSQDNTIRVDKVLALPDEEHLLVMASGLTSPNSGKAFFVMWNINTLATKKIDLGNYRIGNFIIDSGGRAVIAAISPGYIVSHLYADFKEMAEFRSVYRQRLIEKYLLLQEEVLQDLALLIVKYLTVFDLIKMSEESAEIVEDVVDDGICCKRCTIF